MNLNTISQARPKNGPKGRGKRIAAILLYRMHMGICNVRGAIHQVRGSTKGQN
jgi:hypothetical protein